MRFLSLQCFAICCGVCHSVFWDSHLPLQPAIENFAQDPSSASQWGTVDAEIRGGKNPGGSPGLPKLSTF